MKLEPIVGFPMYLISDTGKVWSKYHGRYLTPTGKKNSYLYVTLCRKAGRKNIAVHRLVALAFLPKRKRCKTVNHGNFKRSDNRVGNLEWMRHPKNVEHAMLADRCAKKLTRKQVIEIRRRRKAGETLIAIGKHFGIHKTTVARIYHLKRWRHVGAKPDRSFRFPATCKWCRKNFVPRQSKRGGPPQRIYCSPRHRNLYHNSARQGRKHLQEKRA